MLELHKQICCLFLIILCACQSDPSNREILQQNHERFQQLERKIDGFVERIENGSLKIETPEQKPINIEYEKDSYEIPNTDIIMYEHLLNPFEDSLLFDLQLSRSLRTLLKHYEQLNSDEDWLEEAADQESISFLDQMLGIRYVCIAKTIQNNKPEIIYDDSGRFKDVNGKVILAGYTFEVASGALIDTFKVNVEAKRSFHYLKSDDENKEEALQRGAKVSLKVAAQRRFIDELKNASPN